MVAVTHSKTLVSPSSGSEDKVYGADYVSVSSHAISGLGTGVETALGVNVGSAGAFVANGGALGTPSSGTLTNATGLPAAGVTGTALVTAAIGTTVQAYDADLTTWAGITPGTGVGTALAANIGSAGAPVTFNGALGTPSSGVATNLTGTAAGLTAGFTSLLSTGGAATGGELTLAVGTKTVSTTAATSTCLLFFQRKIAGGTIGFATTYTVSSNYSFTMSSDSALDTSVYAWRIIETR